MFTYFSGIIGKFILNINNEHAQGYSFPVATLCSVHMEKVTLARAVVQRVSHLSKLPQDQEKFT